MAELNWKHHTLIQALMARGPLPEADFRKVFAAVTGKNSVSHPQDFNDCLLRINKELSYVQMELRCCKNQNDGQVCYGLVNNVSDEQSKLGTKYSVPQIAFFKGIIEAIMQDVKAQGSISNIDALNIQLENQVQIGSGSQAEGFPSQVPPALRNFSMSQKEKTLHELVQDKWLCNISDGQIGLGVRSYLDLRSWFHNSCIPLCEVCNEAGLKAIVCPNEDCTVRIHHYCLRKKFSQSRGQVTCPSCGIQWECQVPKAESREEEDDLNVPTQSQPAPASKKKRLRANVNIESREEEDDLDVPTQSQPAPASKKKRLRANVNIESREEEDDLDVPTQSQPAPASKKKRLRANVNIDADTAGCSSSNGAQSVSDLRRVTRASARAKINIVMDLFSEG